MAADPEGAQGLAQWVMSSIGALFGAGAAGKVVLDASAVQARLKALEDAKAEHAEQIATGSSAVARIEGTLGEVAKGVAEIRTWIMGQTK